MGFTNLVRSVFVHYSAAPVVGGVEAVMDAHAQTFLDAGYPVRVIAGRGETAAMPGGAGLIIIPEMDTQHPEILRISAALEAGTVPDGFDAMRTRLVKLLRPALLGNDVIIVHNVLFKHFNLPLTAALFQLIDEDPAGECTWVAWGHDFTWTSPNSRSKVFPGYPWDLLRTPHPMLKYVAVSGQRQQELAGLLGIPAEKIAVIYNGVDPRTWLGISDEGWRLVQRTDLLHGGPLLIMPVRVTQAKNIEFAMQVMRALIDHGQQPKLVITGPPDPHSEASLAYFAGLKRLRAEFGLQQAVYFVCEQGDDPEQLFTISQTVVAELMRLMDVVFMPSHREGFGMPVLEAGLQNVPVVGSDAVPAMREIGGDQVVCFRPEESSEHVAQLIMDSIAQNPTARFRRQVRESLTWERIFTRQIEPIIKGQWINSTND